MTNTITIEMKALKDLRRYLLREYADFTKTQNIGKLFETQRRLDAVNKKIKLGVNTNDAY